MREQLVQVCEEHSIEYRIVDQWLHRMRSTLFPVCYSFQDKCPSARNAVVCQLAWNEQSQQNTRLVFVQSDIFPYQKRPWKSILGDATFYYKPQQRDSLSYAWEGLCLFDTKDWSQERKALVNFEYGAFRGGFGDTGAGLCDLLDALPEIEKKGWSGLNSGAWSFEIERPNLPFWIVEHLNSDPRNTKDESGKILFFSEIQDDWCFHLRAGGNWDEVGREVHEARYGKFLKLLREANEDQSIFL
jgi:hypothetical protein